MMVSSSISNTVRVRLARPRLSPLLLAAKSANGATIDSGAVSSAGPGGQWRAARFARWRSRRARLPNTAQQRSRPDSGRIAVVARVLVDQLINDRIDAAGQTSR